MADPPTAVITPFSHPSRYYNSYIVFCLQSFFQGVTDQVIYTEMLFVKIQQGFRL
jgi:hypothetical protein